MATKLQGIEEEIGRIPAVEKRVAERIHQKRRVSRNIHEVHRASMSFGERLSDRLAEVAGSWRFIIGFFIFIAIWIVVNTVEVLFGGWDPYPFILLNLLLSLMAGLQAPVIMMSQNRQEAKDRLRAEHDYEVNLKAEMEIEQLHAKIDELREKQWAQLIEIQNRQIAILEQQVEMLTRLLEKASRDQ